MKNNDLINANETNDLSNSKDDADILQLYLENKIDFQTLGQSLEKENNHSRDNTIFHDVPDSDDLLEENLPLSDNTLFEKPDSEHLFHILNEDSDENARESTEETNNPESRTEIDILTSLNEYYDTDYPVTSNDNINHNKEQYILSDETHTNDVVNNLINAINQDNNIDENNTYNQSFYTPEAINNTFADIDRDISTPPRHDTSPAKNDKIKHIEEDITKIESSWNRLATSWNNIIYAPEIKSQIEHLWSSIRNNDDCNTHPEPESTLIINDYFDSDSLHDDNKAYTENNTTVINNIYAISDTNNIDNNLYTTSSSNITNNNDNTLIQDIIITNNDASIHETINDHSENNHLNKYSISGIDLEDNPADEITSNNDDTDYSPDNISDNIDDLVNKILDNTTPAEPSSDNVKTIQSSTNNNNTHSIHQPDIPRPSLISSTTNKTNTEKPQHYKKGNINYLVIALVIAILATSIYEIIEYSSNSNTSNTETSFETPDKSTNFISDNNPHNSSSVITETEKPGQLKKSLLYDPLETDNISKSVVIKDSDIYEETEHLDKTIHDDSIGLTDTAPDTQKSSTVTNNGNEYYTPPATTTSYANTNPTTQINTNKKMQRDNEKHSTAHSTTNNMSGFNKWSLNLESVYNNRESAEKELTSLLNKNINAEILEIIIDDSKWYRILIKDFESKQDAIDYMDTVRENSHFSRYWISKSH